MSNLTLELEGAASVLEAGEFETTQRRGQATVNWIGPFGVSGAIQAGRGKKGIYVIYRRGSVVDSGKSEEDLGQRLAQHFEYPQRHVENLNDYRIRLGIVRNVGAVNLAEGTVTRSLAKGGSLPATRPSLATGKNTRVPNTAAFRTPKDRGVTIIHQGRMPVGLSKFTKTKKGQRVQAIGRGQTFESAPPLAALEHELESAATESAGEIGGPERMDPWQATAPIREWWRALPPDVKAQIVAQARLFFQMGGAYLGPFLTALARIFAQNPAGWQQAIETNRAAATQQLAVQAGHASRLPARGASPQPGMTDTQVRDYHRRQPARGRVPGRNRQTGRQRELELELEQAGRELAGPESFYTKVTPIPGLGNKEGHEVLTRAAMRGFPLTPAEQASVLLGVIRPDRGGQSYWNFPLAAPGSLTAAAQPAHALRPTPAASVPAALGFIRARFALLHSQAMRAPTRATALEWLGEALHLLQDSFSSAHVERDSATGRIRYIRAFYVTASWPPFSQAPREHNAPSDTRDDVYLGGTLRPEARAAIWASQRFLMMALRHLGSPLAPSNAAELNAFMNQFLSM